MTEHSGLILFDEPFRGCFDESYALVFSRDGAGPCSLENINDLARMQSDDLNWVPTVGTEENDWEAPICCSGEKCNDE